VLGLLLFRALRHHLRDPSIYFVVFLLGAIFGILDELIQWLVPGRCFDYRDIGINALAGGLVQLALAAGIRPAAIRRPFSLRGLQLACRAACGVLLLLLFCLNNTPRLIEFYSRWIPAAATLDQPTAEYGFRIVDPPIGLFYSRLPEPELRGRDREQGAAAAIRRGRSIFLVSACRCAATPPPPPTAALDRLGELRNPRRGRTGRAGRFQCRRGARPPPRLGRPRSFRRRSRAAVRPAVDVADQALRAASSAIHSTSGGEPRRHSKRGANCIWIPHSNRGILKAAERGLT
jgi:hypothetical protein